MSPLCPQCSRPLGEVRYPSDCYLNRDQWEATIAGNWYCTHCPDNGRGSTGYAYFWNREVQQDTDLTHGEQRLGLLTSSRAKVIMHGSSRAWESLRRQLWGEDANDFDSKPASGPRAYGHEHEAEGAAKFWERHPEYELREGGFHEYTGDGPLKGWLGSSPDRMLLNASMERRGLEIKSPTTPERIDLHDLRKHYDQCQHGLLVTGWPRWWLVVHHGEIYREWRIDPDPAWSAEYLRKAAIFHAFCYEGRQVKRRRLSATDL